MPFFLQPVEKRSAVLHSRHFVAGAAALAAAAGYINSVALGYFHAPVSHMTGTVSTLGIDLAGASFRDAVMGMGVLGGFLLGAVAAGAVLGSAQLLPGRRHGVALLGEAGLLAAAVGLLRHHDRAGIAAAAMACGVQNATTTSYCGLLVRTTHVTGTVTDIGIMLGHWIRHGRIERWKLGFLVGLVLAFGLGVLGGAAANARWGPASLILPALGTALGGALFALPAGRAWFRQDVQAGGNPPAERRRRPLSAGT